MSRFSGKFDFYDFISNNKDVNIKDYNIYLLNKDAEATKLNLKTKEDCIPYYNHLVNMFCGKDMYLSHYPYPIYERCKYGILLHNYYFKKELNEELKKHNLPLKYKKEECEKGFFSFVENIGTLFLVKKFLDDYTNRVYLCKNEDENMFLVFTKDKFEHKYILLSLTKEEIEELNNKEVLLYYFIKNKEKFYLSYEYDMDNDQLKTKTKKGQSLGKKHLPKEDFTFFFEI